jgi:uncharacterized membrane protein
MAPRHSGATPAPSAAARPGAPALRVIHGSRGVPTLVTLRQTEVRDLRDEITALVAEGRELADGLLALARQAQSLRARGWSDANVLDEIERLALRHGARMAAAAAGAHQADLCPDGENVRHIGHGRAA